MCKQYGRYSLRTKYLSRAWKNCYALATGIALVWHLWTFPAEIKQHFFDYTDNILHARTSCRVRVPLKQFLGLLHVYIEEMVVYSGQSEFLGRIPGREEAEKQDIP